jgi:hypothetical protein
MKNINFKTINHKQIYFNNVGYFLVFSTKELTFLENKVKSDFNTLMKLIISHKEKYPNRHSNRYKFWHRLYQFLFRKHPPPQFFSNIKYKN